MMIMDTVLMSIIVPVYNVEKYIVDCISSIIKQNGFDKIELIIVNDGTRDRSVELIQPIIADLPNVTLINQENAGLSVARNVGLKTAKGKYVWFVDSDDTIVPNAISLLFENFESDSDCYGLNLLWVSESDGEKKRVGIWPDSATGLTGIDFVQRMAHLTPVQRYVVKRDILISNNLYFPPGILHEDLEYVPRLLYYVKGIRVISEPLYYYLRRVNGSITAKISERNLSGLCQGVYSVFHFTEEQVDKANRVIYYEKVYEMFQHFIHKYSEYLKGEEDWSILGQNLAELKSVLKVIKGSLSVKEQIHVNCFLMFPSLYVKYRKSRIS